MLSKMITQVLKGAILLLVMNFVDPAMFMMFKSKILLDNIHTNLFDYRPLPDN